MSGDGFGFKGQKQNNRRFSGGGCRPDRADAKRADAVARQAVWAKLTPVQQLQQLDQLLGKNVGAKRQRARLQALIGGKPNPVDTSRRKTKRIQA